jgi:hypothetical protein
MSRPNKSIFHVPAFLMIFALASALMITPCFAQKGNSGRKWQDMDYGPYLTATIEAPQPAGNFAYKGVAVKLWGDDNEAIIFDTDTLRYSAGWTGDYVGLYGVVFDGKHWAYPKTNGPISFSNGVGPGWGKPGGTGDAAFVDPRFRGNDKKPYGPLPRQWGHWKGLYLHGNKVILSYTVGGTKILELPNLEKGKVAAFARSLNISPSKQALILQVAKHPSEKSQSQSGNILVFGEIATKVEAKPKKKDPQEEKAKLAESLKKGLVAHWTFDEIKGQTLTDSAGKHQGKVSNVKSTKGPHGKAISLSGRSKVQIAGSDKLKFAGSDYSISAWINTKDGGTIISKAPASGNWAAQGKTLFVDGGKLKVDVGWVGAVGSDKKVADGKWHHITMTYSNGNKTYRFYVDGQPSGSGILDIGPDPDKFVVKIGQTTGDFGGNFRGAIDDLRMYNRAISLTEIASMAGVKPPAGGGGDTGGAGDVLAVAFVGGPKGTKWVDVGTPNARLSIPASAKASRVKVLIWNGDAKDFDDFKATVAKAAAPEDLTPLTKGGPARWPKKLTTQGKLGTPRKDSPYAVDTITWPDDNPYGSWMRFGGFDFFKDGKRAAICTWSGDVWIVSGIDQSLSDLTWQRIATGMFQPLGLRIVDEQIYVTCRDQITRLHDLNGDGETDFYESFNNDHQVTEHFHEFAMDLQTGVDGNFYYAKSARHARDSLVEHHGTLMMVTKDGSKSEIIANGHRAANGVGVGPNGEFFTSDQEGHWMPANRINLITKGRFYGNMFSYHRGEKPKDYDRPIVWLPKGVDRSPAAAVWVSSDKWGLPKDSVVSISYGTGRIWNLMYEPVKGPNVQVQGAVTKMPFAEFPTGVMRGRFHKDDGQLYVCGLVGWSSNKSKPGGFWRIRYAGKPLHIPLKFQVVKDGVVVNFSKPIDKETATDADSYQVQMWNYKWAANYGSPEYKVNGEGKGRDTLSVKSATLSADGKSVYLQMPGLKPCMQIRVKYDLDAADGSALAQEIYGSVFVIPNRTGASLLK